MNHSVIVRQATEKDLPLISRLINSIYKIQRSVEFWRWQCFNPIIPSVLTLGFCEDQLIGMFGVQKKWLSNTLSCGQASWLNMAPSWQGQGLLTKLGEVSLMHFPDLDAVCVFANGTAKIPCEKAFDLKTIGVIPMMVLSVVNRVVKPLVPFAAQPIDGQSIFSAFSTETPERIFFRYTPEFRLWRYAWSPLYAYHLIVLESGEFAVVKKFLDPVTKICSGDIVDFECPLEQEEKLLALFQAACWFLKKKKVDQITTWAGGNGELQKVLGRLGFEKSSYETYFGFKAFGPRHKDLYDFSRWHLRQADATNY